MAFIQSCLDVQLIALINPTLEHVTDDRITFFLVFDSQRHTVFINGGFQVMNLLVTISHGREKVPDVGINAEGLSQFPDNVGPRVDDLCSSELLGCNDAGAYLHFTMRQGGAILYDKNIFPAYHFRIVDPYG